MALPTKLTLEIVTPDRSLLREEVDEVVVPGANGECDSLPEQAFYMVGTIDEAFEKAKKVQ